jgi:hypothetical protein
MGADKPLDESVPARPKGRQRDLSRERRKLKAQSVAKSSNSDLHGLDEALVEIHDMNPTFLNPEASEHDRMLFDECE